MGRLLAQKLSERLGEQFYVENHGGAGGNIGTGIAAGTAPDGHTILITSSSFVVNPSLHAKVPYDPVKDFAAVTIAAASPNVLVVHPSVAARTVSELVDVVRAKPHTYNFASAGIGTTPHLSGELFRLSLGLDLVHVPFGGAGPALQSTVAGHTLIAFTGVPGAAAQVQAGALRALAVTSAQRSPALPDVPTMAQAGVAGQEARGDRGAARRAAEIRRLRLRRAGGDAGGIRRAARPGARTLGQADPGRQHQGGVSLACGRRVSCR